MMKIKNPYYKSDAALRHEKYQVLIAEYLAKLPANVEYVDYEKLRTDIIAMNLPGVTPEDITIAKIAGLCQLSKVDFLIE